MPHALEASLEYDRSGSLCSHTQTQKEIARKWAQAWHDQEVLRSQRSEARGAKPEERGLLLFSPLPACPLTSIQRFGCWFDQCDITIDNCEETCRDNRAWTLEKSWPDQRTLRRKYDGERKPTCLCDIAGAADRIRHIYSLPAHGHKRQWMCTTTGLGVLAECYTRALKRNHKSH